MAQWLRHWFRKPEVLDSIPAFTFANGETVEVYDKSYVIPIVYATVLQCLDPVGDRQFIISVFLTTLYNTEVAMQFGSTISSTLLYPDMISTGHEPSNK